MRLPDKRPPHRRILVLCGFVLSAALSALSVLSAEQEHVDRASAELNRARTAQQRGDYKAAEEAYQELLRNNPSLLPAQFGLGATLYQERKHEQSNIYLLKTLETNPDFYPALLLLGVNFLKLGQPARAVPYLRHAVSLQPADEYANHNLASAEYLSGDYRSACADYIRYLRMPGKRTDTQSWYGFGQVSVLLAREASLQLANSPPSDPHRLWFLATQYQQQGRWVLAASRLKMLIDQPAWRARARTQLGEVYLRQHGAAQAVAQFQQVLASSPDSAKARFGLGLSLLLEGKRPDAARELAIAAQRDPWLFSRPASFADAGSNASMITSGSFSSGNTLVDAFIDEVTQGTGTHSSAFLAALTSACENRHHENEKRVKAALQSAVPAQSRLDLAADLLDEGDVVAAADLLSRIPRSPQGYSDSRSILDARVAIAKEDPLEGAQLLLPLFGKRQTAESSWWISTLMQEVGRLAMDEVLRLAPKSTFAHLLRAQIEDARHRTAAAIHEYQLALESAPDDPTTHFKLGDMLWQAGRFEEAITALQNGLKLDPRNAAARFQLGDSYLNLADPEKALPLLNEAIHLDPNLIAAYKDLGKIHYDQGEFQESVRLLRKVADRDADGSIHYLLFRSFSRLGNPKEAAVCLRRFQELKKEHEKRELFYVEVARQQEKTFDESAPTP